MTPLAKLLEAALFASGRPLPASELAALDPTASADELASALDEMRDRYDTEGHGIELVELGGGWQILTRPEYTETIERAQLATRPARLSAAALETLAIIAYRQPIGRAEIEEIRGVAVGGMLRTRCSSAGSLTCWVARKVSVVRCSTARRRCSSSSSLCVTSASSLAPTSSRSRCARSRSAL